jgi:hypothetical protein
MQRFIGRAPLLAALVFILAGCGADGGTGPTSIVGSYRLASVNGSPLPLTLPAGTVSDADRSDVYFGALVIGADGTARMSVCFAHTNATSGWITYSDELAHYTRSADALNLAWDRGGMTQARTEPKAISMPYYYQALTLQLRFEQSEPRAPDADPCP